MVRLKAVAYQLEELPGGGLRLRYHSAAHYIPHTNSTTADELAVNVKRILFLDKSPGTFLVVVMGEDDSWGSRGFIVTDQPAPAKVWTPSS